MTKKSPILLIIAVILALTMLYINDYPTKAMTSIVSLHDIEQISIVVYDGQKPTYATLTPAEQVFFTQLLTETTVQKRLLKAADVNEQYAITMKRPTSAYDEQWIIVNDDILVYYPVVYKDNVTKRSTKPRYYNMKNGEALQAFLQAVAVKE